MIENRVEWIKQRPYLCMAPYKNNDHRLFNKRLSITTCCNLDNTFQKNKTAREFIDSIKQQMENKQVPPACHICTNHETNQGISERIKLMLDWPIADLIKFEQDKDINEFQIGTKFSNKCSLACRSCAPNESSFWAEKMRVPAQIESTRDLSDDPVYWKQFTESVLHEHSKANSFILHPIGGEPLITSGFEKLLDWMITQDLAATTTLRITTSFAVNIEQFRDRLSQFRKVTFICSIDSVDENYHYVRWPAKFSRINNNLQEYLLIKDLYPNKYELLISMIFSLNNIFYVQDIMDYWYNWCKANNTTVLLQTTELFRPSALMVQVLPTQYRDSLIPILEKILDHAFFKEYNANSFLEFFKNLLSVVQSPQQYPDTLFEDYLKFSADYDRRTGTDSFVLNSRLYKLLNAQHRDIYQSWHNTADINQPVFNIEKHYL